MQCWTADSQEMYQLVDACGSGGEGTTYQVEGHPELIAKIYNAENLERHFPGASGENEWTMREKIFHMISVRPSLHLTVPQFGDSIDAVAWPTEALFDSRSYFIGFLMPKVEFAVSDKLGITDLHCAYRQWERQRLFGERYSWLTAIKIATNLAAVVQCLHENDIVIGDFNCNNILIDKWGHVTLIDADSLCIHNRQRNITYRCIVGVGEFLAPELQGIALDDTRSRRSFTEESDCFSLAIHIFMLLMNGTHPFSGAKTGDMRQASSSMEPYTKSIANGECPYVTNSTFMPFANTPKVTHLPYYIRDMFDRAFGYATPDGKIPEKTITSRPTAAEWRDALKQLYDECTTSSMVCSRNSSHVNLPKNDTCMWCEAEGVLTPLKDARDRKISTVAPRTESELHEKPISITKPQSNASSKKPTASPHEQDTKLAPKPEQTPPKKSRHTAKRHRHALPVIGIATTAILICIIGIGMFPGLSNALLSDHNHRIINLSPDEWKKYGGGGDDVTYNFALSSIVPENESITALKFVLPEGSSLSSATIEVVESNQHKDSINTISGLTGNIVDVSFQEPISGNHALQIFIHHMILSPIPLGGWIIGTCNCVTSSGTIPIPFPRLSYGAYVTNSQESVSPNEVTLTVKDLTPASVHTSKITAKPNADDASYVVGGRPTRITWEGTAESTAPLQSVHLAFPSGVLTETAVNAKLRVLNGLTPVTTDDTSTVRIHGDSLTIVFDQPIDTGNLIRLELENIVLPAECGNVNIISIGDSAGDDTIDIFDIYHTET